jgi:hypothetical protein
MALYDQRFAKGVLAARWLEDLIASEQMEGIVLSGTGTGTGTGTSTSDSELSTVSSSRFSGLEEDWWKEKTSGAARASTSKATVTVIRTRSKSKRVHWE